MNLSNNKKGFLRDKAMIEDIGKHGVLDTEQITCLHFKGQKNGSLLARRRLKKLFDKKKLKRGREYFNQPFYYYLERKKGQIDHLLGVNWVYAWLKMRLKSWQELFVFEYEVNYGLLRADALAGIYNKITNTYQFYFVEFDRAESGNDFDKVRKYNTLYTTKGYLSSWWISKASGFPKVLIVTTNKSRLQAIRKRIEKENDNGLEFECYLLDKIKGDCLC